MKMQEKSSKIHPQIAEGGFMRFFPEQKSALLDFV
jgi:hypothetical protein